ncbi:GIY-YIG nuclease family protein [Actinomadura sp. NPDC049382]|uniref:GIY-YIG nuclease family protein n=1 Tax=Actinomadura sp. NPDC049382 TaxID=3158220 RepID=UPI003416895B
MRHPGPAYLYRLFDVAGDLLYVGVTRNPAQRWKYHARERRWWHEVAKHELTPFAERAQAEAAEKQAIKAEAPRYNTCHTPRHSMICNKKLTPDEREAWAWARSQDGYPQE